MSGRRVSIMPGRTISIGFKENAEITVYNGHANNYSKSVVSGPISVFIKRADSAGTEHEDNKIDEMDVEDASALTDEVDRSETDEESDEPDDDPRGNDIEGSLTISSDPQYQGVRWIETEYVFKPRWVRLPKANKIKETLLEQGISVKGVNFLAHGRTCEVYRVITDTNELVVRVSLPIEATFKTRSQAATIAWVRRNTLFPVPKVIAFDDTRNNPLGFEWTLMTDVPGTCYSYGGDRKDMSMVGAVFQLAMFAVATFSKQFRGIGNIQEYDGSTDNQPRIGRIVSKNFSGFNGGSDRVRLDIHRGPFKTTKEWLLTKLTITERDCLANKTRLEYEDSDDEDADSAWAAIDPQLETIKKLKVLIERHTPSKPPHADGEPTMLHHDRLTTDNVLRNERGQLTGVVNWENVSAVPLWRACDVPKITYWGSGHKISEHTVPKQTFLDIMAVIEPKWLEIYKASQFMRDLNYCVDNLTDFVFSGLIEKWVADHFDGKERVESLEDTLWAEDWIVDH